VARSEEDAIGAGAAAKNPFPLWTFERFHITLEGVGRNLVQGARNAPLNVTGQV